MSHLGHHRLLPARSKACREKEKLACIDREILAAAEAGNIKLVESLQAQRASVLINSLIP